MIMNLDSAMENEYKYSTRLSQVHKAETRFFFTAIGRRHDEVDSMVIERGRLEPVQHSKPDSSLDRR